MSRREKQQPSFAVCKANALRKLAEADKSPKGCLDPHIAPLVHAINAHPDYVTTSSCAGRVVLWAEGSGAKAETQTETDDAGGRWLLCQHDRVSMTQIEALVPPEAAPAEAAQVAPAPPILSFRRFFPQRIIHRLRLPSAGGAQARARNPPRAVPRHRSRTISPLPRSHLWLQRVGHSALGVSEGTYEARRV